MEVTVRPTVKQYECFELLGDEATKDILFGGSAGCGKSWLGCEWLISNCFFYPGSKWYIGREELKRLRDSTVVTFYKALKHHRIPQNVFRYNGQDHYFEHENGSRIDLLDLKYLPSDPMYERYGSVEFTGGWIEEGGEVHFGAFDTLKSRVGRHGNQEYGIIGKTLITCNPKKNWLYQDFYKPYKDGTLSTDKAVVLALPEDNIHISSDYIENLKRIKDKAKKERLLYGNWEYDDNPAKLMDYDAILALFTNSHVKGGDKYLTADIARYGADKTVIMLWNGYRVEQIVTIDKSSLTQVADTIKRLASENSIPMFRVMVDEDGLGGGVKDILRCKGFVANSRAEKVKGEQENYANLKSQCYFRLADRINSGEIYMYQECEELVEELEVIQQKDLDKDTKKAIMPKEKMKDLLGRSPDYADTLMMRMAFDLKSAPVLSFGVL